MIEIVKTPGTHISYTTTKKNIILGADEDLSINLQIREKDEIVTIDICTDQNGELTMGAAAGLRYVAEIEIPARQYVETQEKNKSYQEGADQSEYITKREPVPFNIDLCTIRLWGLEE